MDRFPQTEWSGPAWYEIKSVNEHGFPADVELKHFVPLDLGTTASTEVDGEELGKLLPKLYKKHKHLKSLTLGLIHSHHNMGAFFSGTDKDTSLDEALKDSLFFSTVVASKEDYFAFSVSYRDAFGHPFFVEGEVPEQEHLIIKDKQWVKEANSIVENAKPLTMSFTQDSYNKKSYGNFNYGYGFGGSNIASAQDGYGNPISKARIPIKSPVSNEELLIAESLMTEFEDGTLTEKEFCKHLKLDAPGVDPHLFVDGWYK